MLIIFCVLGSSYAYSDIEESYWGYEAITELTKKEILSGYPDGTFKPDNNMSRAEFITILIKIIEPNADVSVGSAYWAEGSIRVAKERNIILEDEYSHFEPDKDITRREICLMLYRGVEELKGINIDKMDRKIKFSDISENNAEEKVITDILSHIGVLTGYPDGSARLDKVSTRAETCCFINNFMKSRCILLSVINDQSVVLYENDVATVNALKLPAILKKWKNSKDIPYVTTKITGITMFPFDNPAEKYKDVFETINTSYDRYLEYRKRFGEGNYVVAIEFETMNNTNKLKTYAGAEFLHISFPKEEISIIDIFDTDEMARQLNKNANVGQIVMPGEMWNTSAFYIVDTLPKEKIRLDRFITDLYDVDKNQNYSVNSFHSLIVNLGGQ